MTLNKQTVQKYMDAYNQLNHAEILACLSEDVVWDIPGAFHVTGKVAFDKEIENDAFVGKPVIQVMRMTEENDVVVVEGKVQCTPRSGGLLNLVFCDVFLMRNGQIKQLTSYLMEVKA